MNPPIIQTVFGGLISNVCTMKIIWFFSVVILFSSIGCQKSTEADATPNPLDSIPVLPPVDTLDSIPVLPPVINPYEKFLGTYRGNCYTEDKNFNPTNGETTYTRDTIESEIKLLRVDTNTNGSLIIRTNSGYPDFFFVTPEELAQDTLFLSEHIGPHSNSMIVVQSEGLIIKNSISHDPYGPGWFRSECKLYKQ